MPAESPKQIPLKTRQFLLPAWRARPFAGLRWQLTFVYSILFSLLVLLFSFFAYFTVAPAITQSSVLTTIQAATLLLIGIGTCAVFFLTNLMLRPLRHLSDAAQAITLGDLQQRQRLEPLLQGDDEVGKLAASLNEIVDQLDRASLKQQASEDRLRLLFSDASHQLRTPLTSLRGFTEVLLRGGKDDPETTQRVLSLMYNETERMTRLVNDLLVLARLDNDPLQTEALDLVDFAVEAVEQAKVLTTDGRKVSLCLATNKRLRMQANADRLKHVLQILFDNALKYGRPAPDGWIRLQLDQQNGYVLLQVIDNGKGIDPNDLPSIFDRFYRGEHIPTYGTRTTPPQGAGLGLSIALAIVHAHQGDITVCSEPEKETVFTVRLPLTGK